MKVTLESITTKITKGTTPTSVGCSFESSGVNYIKSESIGSGRSIDRSKFAYISEKTHEKLKRSQIQKKDILFSMAGMFLGKTGIVTSDMVPANTNQAVAIIRVDHEKANYEYIYYFLNQPNIVRMINTSSAQSAQPNINLKQIGQIVIDLPDRQTQDRIAAILSVIDFKIEQNSMINHNLYNQMLVIFNNAHNTASWNRRKLDDVLIFFDNRRKPLSAMQREKMSRIYPYYGATSVVDYVEDYLFEGTYILVSEDGANVVDASGHPLTQYTYGKFWLNNHAHIVKGTNGYSEALIYALFGTLNLQSIVTGAAQPKINQANLKNFEVELPENDEAQALSDILNPMLHQMIFHDQENKRLSALRDTLLPKFMSGELDVSDIDL